MNRTPLSIPEIAIIGGTRAALGAGVAFLLADRIGKEQRRAIGWTLLTVGLVTTIPIAIEIFRGQIKESGNGHQGGRPAMRQQKERIS